MLREQVIQEWNSCKEKIDELTYELFAYQRCFIIADQDFCPESHDQAKILLGLGIPEQVIARHELQTGLTAEVKTDLTYSYDGRTFISGMVVLIWEPTIEEID